MLSNRLKKLKDAGLIGCLNYSGITSLNYKQVLKTDFDKLMKDNENLVKDYTKLTQNWSEMDDKNQNENGV